MKIDLSTCAQAIHNMEKTKYERFGVQLDKRLAEKLDHMVKELNTEGWQTNRSEVLETIFEVFYMSYFSKIERFITLLILKRMGGLNTGE